jgi:hypothetical protein
MPEQIEAVTLGRGCLGTVHGISSAESIARSPLRMVTALEVWVVGSHEHTDVATAGPIGQAPRASGSPELFGEAADGRSNRARHLLSKELSQDIRPVSTDISGP